MAQSAVSMALAATRRPQQDSTQLCRQRRCSHAATAAAAASALPHSSAASAAPRTWAATLYACAQQAVLGMSVRINPNFYIL